MKRIDITLSQLETLLAVARHRSFSRAAIQLGLSQSAVSHAVAALERQLDVTLLERKPGGVAVRTSAAGILEHANAAVAAIDRLRIEASRQQEAARGTLRIGTFPSTTIRVVPRLLGEFRRTHPAVEPTLYAGTASQIRHWLAAGIVDVGFVELPVKDLEIAAAFDDELLAVIPDRSPLARKPGLSVDDLRSFRILLSQYGCEPLIEAAHKAARAPRRVDMELQDMTTLMAFVREGIGATLLPRLAVPDSLRGVVAIPIVPRQVRRVGLAICAAPHRTRLLDRFVEVARRELRRPATVSAAHARGRRRR